MGWWSYDILGGDPPMDTLMFLADHIETEDLYPLDFTDEEASIICAKLEQAELSILENKQLCSDDALPVVAAAFLSTGAAMSDKFRSKALRATRNDYYASGAERAAIMAEFAILIENHEAGKRIEIEDKDLFQTMEESDYDAI